MTEARKKKLQTILDRLNGGKIVQNRQLQTMLGEEGYARYLDDWRVQEELRETLKNKPNKVKEYEERLKKAMFAYSKGDAASGRGQSRVGETLIHNAQHEFERTLEHLSEALKQDPSLQMWFDRHPDSEIVSGTRLSPQNMPQVVTSRSAKNRGGGHISMLRSIRQVKIDAVERELDLLNRGGAAGSQDEIAAVASHTNRLKKLLGKRE